MKTVLVIEDELTVRESLVDLLEIEGFRAIAADNGKTGLTIAITEQPRYWNDSVCVFNGADNES